MSSATQNYHARTSVLETPRIYELNHAALCIRAEAAKKQTVAPPPRVIPLVDIKEMRLRFQPTRAQTNRYECLLTTRSGSVIKITNEFYRGIMSFEDRSADYCAFVKALAAQLTNANPTATFARGSTVASYYFSLLFVTVVFAILAIVLFFLGPPTTWLVIVKLGLIAVFIPTLVRWAKKNKPKEFDPKSVPTDILP